MTHEPTHTKTLEISFTKAAAILAGAILSSIVGTAFTALRIANSDHFTLLSIRDRVSAIEDSRTDLVPRFLVLEEQNRQTREDIAEIKNDLKDIKNYLNIR